MRKKKTVNSLRDDTIIEEPSVYFCPFDCENSNINKSLEEENIAEKVIEIGFLNIVMSPFRILK